MLFTVVTGYAICLWCDHWLLNRTIACGGIPLATAYVLGGVRSILHEVSAWRTSHLRRAVWSNRARRLRRTIARNQRLETRKYLAHSKSVCLYPAEECCVCL